MGVDLLRLGGLMETWSRRSTRRRRSAEDKTTVSAGRHSSLSYVSPEGYEALQSREVAVA